ncbi:hypothetical protein B0H34DRAFT_714612 [Crassisporium funariophilum]|nr:hypothetical protein B0H34DRAFT_714612 [Crassisporium funariophilum]
MSPNFLLLLTLFATFLQSSAYIITTEPWQTDRPIPDSTLFYNIVVETGDPVLVDVLLVNGRLGNVTTIFGDSDLTKPEDSKAGFTVPFCPPGKQYAVRLVETSTKRFLKDSPEFQIFPAGTPSGAPTTGAQPTSTTSSPSLSPPTATTPSATSTTNTPSNGQASNNTGTGTKKSSTPVGPIVGGVLGGLAFLAIILAIILCRRKRKRVQNFDGEKTSKGVSGLRLGEVRPFMDIRRPAIAIPGADGVYASGLVNDSNSTVPTVTAPLPRSPKQHKAGYLGSSPIDEQSGYTPNSAITATSTRFSSMQSRTEVLRQERERIDREIATLESSSGGSMYTSSSRHPHDRDIADQLAALKEQIRQMELRQNFPLQDLSHSEPPPVYDAASPIEQPVPATRPRPLPARTPPVDSKLSSS